eukprot:TRINITY_DN10882_c0_g1_i2.p1 TRINITY_DN10882_c0_g1~~TRINITY_DN10882_c0_g1_i2.p1  ORF type:complete len:1058 (+),score=235.92 TRINITY_DN10882_c0_g1_i2:60-3233(+)
MCIRDRVNRTLNTQQEGETGYIKMMLEKGTDVNNQNLAGDSALHIVCRRLFDAEDVIDVLMQHGADINAVNKHKQSPLRCAILLRNKKRVAKLLEWGAIVTQEDLAAAKDVPNILQLLQSPPLIVGKDLQQLSSVVTEYKQSNAYSKLSEEEKKLIDSIPKLITTINTLNIQNDGIKKQFQARCAGSKKEKKKKQGLKLSSHDTNMLNQNDWDLLLTVAEVQMFTKDTQIVYRGMYSKYLYVVKKGQVRVEKDGRLIATIGETEIFGEMSLVDRYGTASASVVAHSDNVELYAIEAPFIYKLLISDSTNLALRFFRYIALILSIRLKVWAPPKPQPSLPYGTDSSKSRTATVGSKTRQTHSASDAIEPVCEKPEKISLSKTIGFIKKMKDEKEEEEVAEVLPSNRPKDEEETLLGYPILKETPCSFKRGAIKYNGKMTVTKQTIFLEAKLFSHKVKEFVDFSVIKSISRKDKKRIQIVTNDKRHYSIYLQNCAEIIVILEGISRGKEIKNTQPVEKIGEDSKKAPLVGLEFRAQTELSNHQNALRLTENDWEEILKGAKSMSYKKDEVLIQEKLEYNNLYQISRGSCRIEKQGMKLGVMHQDEVFGEIGFLERTEASASVIAESNRVNVYIIEGRYLDLLFRENGSLGGRFYFYLCTLIGERLHSRHKHYHESECEISIKDIVEKPLHLELPKLRVKPIKPNAKVRAKLIGPPLDQTNDPTILTEQNLYRTRVCAKTISTYPYDSVYKRQLGDPICDQYCVEIVKGRTIVALADGCNWGPIVREAASKASQAFVSYISSHSSEVCDIQGFGELIIRGFSIAHNAIIEGKDPTSTPVGTSTLLGGLLLELETDEHNSAPYGFVFGSVGDCKAFLYSAKQGRLTDFTNNSRQDSLDPTDCGGRLGPYIDGLLPDLRNFRLGFGQCYPNDVLFIVSDGVHDNLDAVQLGMEPSEFGFSFTDWHSVSTPQERTTVEAALDAHRSMVVSKIIEKTDKSVQQVTAAILQYCIEVNKKAADWMTNNPGKKLPSNYKLYPGKMDHTSCVCLKVPNTKGRSNSITN